MFEAILVSVLLNGDGTTMVKEWAAFPSMDDCKLMAQAMTIYTSEYSKGTQPGEGLVFRCDKPKGKK